MIEDVKKLSAELRVDALPEMPVLGHREIEVSEAGVGKVLRDMLPNCPSGGGIMIELPWA